MDLLDCGEQEPALIGRRMLVATLAGSVLSQVVPAAHAQPDADALKAFIALSRFLTGRGELDADQARQLHEALHAQAGDFDADARALLVLIAERKLAIGRLQLTLDTEASRLAPLPRKIVSAWYTGIVGEDERARCVLFETSLMYAAVKDRLTPPSYCHGPHASWASPPG
ncbi:MAG: Membrane bound containing D-sorbitol dehydrogenase [Ramlibacter sp.]|jgi:hypothetical protein|nr:Membrane bound containing D-sorbitol dehydrogenase [Ramlibacter sp.]